MEQLISHGKYGDFYFDNMWDYICKQKQQMRQPLSVPEYAAAGEQEQIKAVNEMIAQDPLAGRVVLNKARLNNDSQMGSVRPVSYHDYPGLYQAAAFVAKLTKEMADLDLLVQVYTQKGKVKDYNASAYSWLGKAWIYISEDLFRGENMLTTAEVCYFLGHELGHALCRHSIITLLGTQELDREREYSADRTGLIVCAKWLMAQKPQASPKELAREALMCSIAALNKIHLADEERINIHDYDYGSLEEALDSWWAAPAKLPRDNSTHPCPQRRAMAEDCFSRSQLFYKHAGLPMGSGLLDDNQLWQNMSLIMNRR